MCYASSNYGAKGTILDAVGNAKRSRAPVMPFKSLPCQRRGKRVESNHFELEKEKSL